MQDGPILVTGATGKSGSRIAARLQDRGVPVRAGSRRAAPLFDWEDPTTWGPALDGAQAVYICFQPDFAYPGALERLAAFAEATRVAGVGRLVMITGRGEPYARRGEDIVTASSVPTTILRAAWFAQNFSEGSLRDAILDGVVPMPGGDIREPILDLDDLADVAVAALTEDGHAGKTYELTGPEALSFPEVADKLTAAIGQRVTYLPISFEEFHAELERSVDTLFADIVTEIAQETFDGRNAHTTDDVARLLGRAPRDFASFARAASRAGAWSAAA